MEYDMIRYFSEEILNGLDYLHKNNVIHRDVRDSCVFIDNNGIVKLGDCSVEKRLYEFSTRTQNQHRKDNKKTDIYKFGLLILSLIRGSLIDENEEKHLKVPVKLPLDLRDFLNKCIVADERDRWSAAQLLKHNFIRARIERCSPARVLDSTPPKNGDGRGDSDKSNDDDTEDDFDIHSLIPVQNGGQSRIQTEFEILKWLGRGAFGDVLKVKNKLDGGCYAIKRIRLNPNNIQLNRKITREVKLLSRLSHENVVRYYNSWIEKADIKEENTPGKHAANMSPLGGKTKNNDDLTGFVIEDLEKINPNKLEWSTSCGGKNQNSTSSDEDSSDDEEWSVVFNPENDPESESSDSIEFERDNSTNSDTASLQSIKESTKNVKNVTVRNAITRQIQFMYIQMELCEKSTLRTAIDKGLHKDNDRVWRLFREIVDGLSHIHQQGMIHRDLKPVNIFLDSNDHVKIGDFGLATSNIITRPNTGIEIINKSTQEFGESNSQDTPSVGDGSLTGEVGTALYVAPEIITKASKTYIYNQKVDIYSLGIILFEMVYPPLPTAMERVKVLANLRQKAIIFPTDFNDVQYSRFLRIIRWLLHHDPSQRPTTQELLQSQHIPPPQIEEGELQDLLRRTLANTQTKAYKYLISSCFDQNLSTADDITYDLPREDFIAERPLLIEKVKETITEIFKLHGGDCLTTPLLMPRSKYYEGVDSCVKMMSHSGYIVTIPHDLRIPFARYVARNNIHLMKRYSIERVYREKKVHGFHPRELYECAFDIITPKPGKLMAEAELLSIVYEIIQEFPKIKHKNYTIRLNHRSLLRAMLLYGGIEEEKHNDIYSILSDARDNKLSKFQVQTHLISLCLTDNGVIQVGKLMETEVSLKNLKSHFRPLTRRKGEIGDLAKKAIDDLELITSNTEALGVKCNIIVAPGLVHNIQQYSGMMCQFVCELQSKKKKTMGVIAAGGRFDEMLQSFRSILGQTGIISKGDLPQSGAGISISIDTLVQLLREEQHDINSANADVHICSTDSKSMIREKCSILRDFWSAGIRCSLIDTNLMYDNLDEKRKIKSVHTVILKDSDLGMALVRSSDKDRFQEKKVPISELVEFVQRLLRTWNGSTNESVSSSNLYSRSDSRSMSISSDISPGNLLPDVTVRFVTHEKLSATARRRLENQILSHLTLKLQQVSNRSKVIILAVHLDSSVIKTLISHIDLESDYSEFQRDVTCAIERCPGQKKHILELSEHIFTICNENNSAVIVLYSVPDSYFKILF